jgi:phosphoribosylglycinamide formyltransferase-1
VELTNRTEANYVNEAIVAIENEEVTEPKLRVAVLASGTGSNLQALIDAQAKSFAGYEIVVVISDKPGAKALERAKNARIPAFEVLPKTFASKNDYEQQLLVYLENHGVDLVVLAGYMRIVGTTLLEAYEGRMINLHPSLLPAFQGIDAQKQAIEAGVKLSGCTMHFVDIGLDTGPIIAQSSVMVDYNDDEASLKQKIQVEEHKLIVNVVELIAEGRVIQHGRRVEIL